MHNTHNSLLGTDLVTANNVIWNVRNNEIPDSKLVHTAHSLLIAVINRMVYGDRLLLQPTYDAELMEKLAEDPSTEVVNGFNQLNNNDPAIAIPSQAIESVQSTDGVNFPLIELRLWSTEETITSFFVDPIDTLIDVA